MVKKGMELNNEDLAKTAGGNIDCYRHCDGTVKYKVMADNDVVARSKLFDSYEEAVKEAKRQNLSTNLSVFEENKNHQWRQVKH